MSFKYIDNPKGLKVIKKILSDRFAINPTDEETRKFLSVLEKGTKEKYKDVPGFSDSKIHPIFFGGENLDNMMIFFSPNIIFSEMGRIINKEGLKSLAGERKYQMMREMIIASYVALGIRKKIKDKVCIAVSDSPDIMLSSVSERSWKEKPLNFTQAEVVQIPHHIREKWGNLLDSRIIEFVAKKKSTKRYSGPTGLIIGLELRSGDNLEFCHEEIKESVVNYKTGSIFEFITIVMYMPIGGKDFTVTWIHPAFDYTYIRLDQEKELLY